MFLKINSAWQFLAQVIKKNCQVFIGLTALIAITKVVSIIPPLLLGKIVDTLGTSEFKLTAIDQLIGQLALIGIVSFLIIPLQQYYLSKFTQENILDASKKWVREILKKDFFYFAGFRVGEVLKLTERGIEAHEKFLYFVITLALPLTVEFFVFAGALIWVADVTILVITIFVSITHLTITYFLVNWRRKQIDSVNSAEDRVSGGLAEVISNAFVIKVEKAEASVVKNLSKDFAQYARSSIKLSISGSILTSSQNLLLSLATVLMLFYGARSVQSEDLSIGALIAAFSLSSSFLGTVNGLGESYRFLVQFMADVKPFFYLLSQQKFERSGQQLSQVSKLTLLPLTIIAEGSQNQAVVRVKKPISFKKGEKIAIIGVSGSGKSLLLSTLSGLNSKSREFILLDGVKVSDVSSNSHLFLIRYCHQKPLIMSGNVFDAVFFGNLPEYNQVKVNSLLQKLKLPDDIVSGERYLKEDAQNLSGGEAKRLALARILLKPGEFNFLDEPTASVDKSTEGLVWDIIFRELSSKTVVCVTHDLNVIKRFERVILISNGDIVEDGSPEKVLASEAYIEFQKFEFPNRLGSKIGVVE